MPKPSNNQSNKRRPQKRGGRKRSHSPNLPEGLPADVEEYGEDLAALEEADGEEINIGHLQNKDIAELNAMAKDMEVENFGTCLLYTSPSPRDLSTYRMPSSA